jgi:predicted membrane chloride channel (bestrophin family)
MAKKQKEQESVIISDFEMESVSSIRQRAQQIFLQLGQIAVERRNRNAELDNFEESLLDQHLALSNEEQQLFESLREKYGDGSLNPNTGEFTPN